MRASALRVHPPTCRRPSPSRTVLIGARLRLGLADSTLGSNGRVLPRLGGWLEITMAGADGAGGDECTESGSRPARGPGLTTSLLDAHQLENCLALDQRCFGGLWSRQQWCKELADPHRPGLGLWQDGRLVATACAWLILDELHITLVAVDPSRRRLGLGRLVLRALLLHGLALGAARATLEVSRGNQAALALYQTLGFQTTGVRRNYYSTGEDALIQWLDLASLQ